MGNNQASFKHLPHVWIQKPSACEKFVGEVHFKDQSMPEGIMSTVDSMLWHNFSTELDHHVPRLNISMRWTWILFFTALAITIIFSTTVKETLPFARLLIWLPIVPFYMKYYSIIKQNQNIDIEIKKVCEMFDDRFKKKGYSIEYKTEWTKFCKPKYAKASRVIVFHPFDDIKESKQNTNEYFDRKSWGLELNGSLST